MDTTFKVSKAKSFLELLPNKLPLLSIHHPVRLVVNGFDHSCRIPVVRYFRPLSLPLAHHNLQVKHLVRILFAVGKILLYSFHSCLIFSVNLLTSCDLYATKSL